VVHLGLMKSSIKNCDSLITDIQGVIVGVLTAGLCSNFNIVDPQNRVVSAVHAGVERNKREDYSKNSRENDKRV